jgi:hypothetical protein
MSVSTSKIILSDLKLMTFSGLPVVYQRLVLSMPQNLFQARGRLLRRVRPPVLQKLFMTPVVAQIIVTIPVPTINLLWIFSGVIFQSRKSRDIFVRHKLATKNRFAA